MTLHQFGLSANAGIFVVAAVLEWTAGFHITRYTEVISERTGLDQAFVGLLLLVGVTSLPELVVAITLAVPGRRRSPSTVCSAESPCRSLSWPLPMRKSAGALTSVTPDPVVFIQGRLKIVLLSIMAAAIMAAAITVGDISALGVALRTWLLCTVAAANTVVLAITQCRKPSTANDAETDSSEEDQEQRAGKEAPEDREKPLSWVLTRTAIAGAVVIGASYLLSRRTADALADQTGLAESSAAPCSWRSPPRCRR